MTMNAQTPPGTQVVPAAVEKARSEIVMGAKMQGLVPTSFAACYEFAKVISNSGLAPKGMERPETIMAAVMHGLEVGLTPFAAIQSIAVVNGRPTIWGDGALGLVRGSGLLEYMHETITGSGQDAEAVCEVKRAGEDEPVVRTFSWSDAKQAGLLGKQGPWTQYPKRMMQMRARSWALRDGFADVLRGLRLREEVQDEEETLSLPSSPPAAPSPAQAQAEDAVFEEVKPAPAAAPSPPPAAPAAPEEPKPKATRAKRNPTPYAEQSQPPKAPEPSHVEELTNDDPPAEASDEEVVDALIEQFGTATEEEHLHEAMDAVDVRIAQLPWALRNRVEVAFEARKAELTAPVDTQASGSPPPADESMADADGPDYSADEPEETQEQYEQRAFKAGVAAYRSSRSRALIDREFKDNNDGRLQWVRGWDEAKKRSDAAQPGAASPPPASPPQAGPDPLTVAYKRGAEAKAKGMAPKAIPGEYRADDRADELTAWQNGYNGSPL